MERCQPTVIRIPDPKLAKKYAKGEVTTLPFMMASTGLLDWLNHPNAHSMFCLNRKIMRQLHGAPDGVFNGEWQYALYQFEITHNNRSQRFIVFADPIRSGKGSTYEILGEPISELQPLIWQWMGDEWSRATGQKPKPLASA